MIMTVIHVYWHRGHEHKDYSRMSNKLTTSEFVERAKKGNGEERYDYSERVIK